MLSDKPFNRFESKEQQLEYLHLYKFIAPTKNKIPTFYFRKNGISKACKILGYEQNYETWSITVIDFGEGPYFIHSDYLRDMQTAPTRNKGERITSMPDTYVIFDLETTDLNIYTAEVIQIAAIRIANGEIVDSFSTFVKPENPIPEHISKLTGITDLDVCMSPDIKTVLPQFLEYVGTDCLVGYNIHTYDTNILFDLTKSLLGIDFKNNYFDLLYYFKEKISSSEISDYKLTTISNYFGLDTTSAHNALTDCHLCFDCYNAINSNVEVSDSDNEFVKIENVNRIKTSFDKKLFDKLNEYILSKKLPDNALYIYSNCNAKGKEISKSVCINEPPYPQSSINSGNLRKNMVCFNYTETDSYIKLLVRESRYNAIPVPNAYDVKFKANKNGNNFYQLTLSLSDEHLYDYIMSLVAYCIKNYRSNSDFGCCSRFTECSDAKECIHENKLYATGCKYRQNLENGRIFYGKNRNID